MTTSENTAKKKLAQRLLALSPSTSLRGTATIVTVYSPYWVWLFVHSLIIGTPLPSSLMGPEFGPQSIARSFPYAPQKSSPTAVVFIISHSLTLALPKITFPRVLPPLAITKDSHAGFLGSRVPSIGNKRSQADSCVYYNRLSCKVLAAAGVFTTLKQITKATTRI